MRLALNAWFWDSPTTGSGQYVRQLVHALEDLLADLQIVLVVPSAAGRGEGIRAMASLPGSCLIHAVPCPRSHLAKVRFEQLAFPRACDSVRADVAHVPYWGPPLRSPVPFLVTIHDLIPRVIPSYRGGALQRLYTALVGAGARRAALVLTDSKASRRDILSHVRLPVDRVRSVPLAAGDRYGPEPETEDASIRAHYELPDTYILYLGGFDRRKNLTTLLAAYRQAASALAHPCPLVIAGRLPARDTSFTPHPRRLMHEQSVPEAWIHFSGFIDEDHKPAVYRGARAFLFPSRYEGFGLPPLEALACGIPVVGSDAGSMPETVGDGGILRAADDAKGMAEALIRLVTDDSYRSEMRQRALDQAAKFSWKTTAEETLAAYRQVRR